MGYEMRRSFLSIENIFEFPPHSGKPHQGGAPHSILSGIRFLDRRCPRQRQRPSVAPSLLLQSCLERSGREVPEDGEINLGTSNRSSEAPPLLPGSYHRSSNKISDEASVT